MTLSLGVVMDPIASIHYKKDTTLAFLWEAQARGWNIYYFELPDLFMRNGVPYGAARGLEVFHDANGWFKFKEQQTMALGELDIILMRKDPPVDDAYMYATYILQYAERLGTLVINRPQALRDCNEKFFAQDFPQCTPPTLISAAIAQLQAFWHEHGDIVCKPLNSMAGNNIFRLRSGDSNANVIFTTLTQQGSCPITVQRFLPEIVAGDKRILLINGEPVTHALARVPQGVDWRGNLAAGAKGVPQLLSERDKFICAQVGPVLRERGLYFVGIDVIGDYLTEINVTSPTCMRELDAGLGSNISAQLLDFVERSC